MKKRILAWMLVVLMVVSLLPEAAFAAEASTAVGGSAASVEAKTPSAITIDTDSVRCLGASRNTLVGKKGDTFQLKAYDETGAETPVSWSSGNAGMATVDEAGLLTIESALSSGSTSIVTITATSTLDTTVKKEMRYSLSGFYFSEYQKNTSVALSKDGQSAKTVYVSGGFSGNNIWSYDEEAAAGIASPVSEPGTGGSYRFNVYRPGTFTVTVKADFDEQLTDTATITITGVAVEDSEGTQGKTYLTKTSEKPNPTMQLTAYCEEGKSIASWSSANEEIASVDEHGLVTAKGVGTVLITATDGDGSTSGIKVVVKDGETPYFESLEFLTSGLSNWKAEETFAPTKLSYDLQVRTYSTTKLALQATTLYDTEKHRAVAVYEDIDGTAQQIEINSGKITYLENIPFDDFQITISIFEKQNPEKKTDYVFRVNRPRDETKQIKSTTGMVLSPEGRSLFASGVKYNGYAEGTFLRATEDGTPNSGTGITGTKYNYRTYVLGSQEAFRLVLSASTNYAHIRYRVAGEAAWTEVAQGGSTKKITFPATEEGTPVVKVEIQILDDKTYHKNVVDGKEGFADSTPTEYALWVEQAAASPANARIITAQTAEGDWYPDGLRENIYDYNIVVPNGTTEGTLDYTVATGASVKVGNEEQISDEQKHYSLKLKTTKQTVTVSSEDGISCDYSFKLQAKSKYDVPDKVVDYLCIGSQYTNGGTAVQPETTLSGSMKSLGNFGGYITYYYKNGIQDDPKNKYGMDFYVYGNSFQDGGSAAEPGQIYVSEDGENWYALAGSEHYEAKAHWDYTITYTKGEDGKARWTDNLGNSIGATVSTAWPNEASYYMNSVWSQEEYQYTGIVLDCLQGGIMGDSSTSSLVAECKFGYSDYYANGTIGADVNPYIAKPTQANGFDLAWAVDAEGNPVDVSKKEFHYVKVATASNIWAGAFAEKSTEIAQIIRTEPQEEAVGKTTAPESITISDGISQKVINFTEGQQIYEANIDDMKYVSVAVNGTVDEDNIYINNQRVVSGEAAAGFKVTKESGEKLIRIIVQNGEKEPVLYLLKLTGSATEKDELIEDVKVQVGGAERYASTKDGKAYELTVGHSISRIAFKPIVKEGVTYTIQEGTLTEGTEKDGVAEDNGGDGPGQKEGYDLTYGANTFTIAAKDSEERQQTVVLKVVRENAPVISGDEITVSFTLYGDSKHGQLEKLHTYQSDSAELPKWVETVSYTVPKESCVLDVLKKALEEKGLSYKNAGGNYISEINGLAEVDNGTLSGWMYLVNGRYPSRGVAEQTLKDGDEIVFHYTDDYTKERSINESEIKAADEVIAAIDAIGEITAESGAAIQAARAAYNGLTQREKELVTNYDVLAAAEKAYKELTEPEEPEKPEEPDQADYEKVLEETKSYLLAQTPGTGSVGGEWLVMGLARSGAELNDQYRKGYLKQLQKFIAENINSMGHLAANKSAENSRVILALTALGYSPANVKGKNILQGLADFNFVKKQGINGPIWALLALDSKQYEIPELKGEGTQTTREGLLNYILEAQLTDGGWSLSGEAADTDVTAMALQALAPYYAENEAVKAAVDKALVCLSDMQGANGGYGSRGVENAESCAQVLAALASLGIDGNTDERFVKNGNSVLDALLAYAMTDGGFRHTPEDQKTDQMATEQSFYALAAYQRFQKEQNSLYDMTDVVKAVLRGDADGNLEITVNDALTILMWLADKEPKNFDAMAAECDGKERVTVSDALQILMFLAEKVQTL